MIMLKTLAYCLAAATLVLAQEAVGDAPARHQTMTLPGVLPTLSATNIPFFANGACNTLVHCGSLGAATVTTITTTIPGISPTDSPVTITPTRLQPGVTHTVWVVPTVSDLGRETVTITIPRGGTISTSLPATPENNAPETVWVYPAGPAPTKTVTVTSTLEKGHQGERTLTLPGPPPLAGMDTTITVIPPVTSDLTVTACPPQATVTIVKQPEIHAAINVTNSEGKVEQRPTSIFPCSKDDRSPCRGTQVQGWTVFKTLFDAAHPMDGKSYPGPWKRDVSFAYDTILTVSDSWYQAEHWTITLDGKKLGETQEDGFKNNMLSCSWDGDSCISKGFSHGSFRVPAGQHSLQIEWTDGPLTYGGGYKWTHGYGVYRFDRLCSCGSPSGHDEL